MASAITQAAIDLAFREYPIRLDHYPDDSWAALYPDLPGCIGGGDTREDALRDLVFASLDYIQFMLDTGLDVPAPGKGPEVVIMQCR